MPPVPDTPANVDIVIEEHVEEDTTTPASNEAETEEDPTGEDVVEDSVSESSEDDAQASESETTVAPPDQEEGDRNETPGESEPADRPEPEAVPERDLLDRIQVPETEKRKKYENPLIDIDERSIKTTLENLGLDFQIRGISQPRFSVRQGEGDRGKNKKEIEIMYEKKGARKDARGRQQGRQQKGKRFSIKLSCEFDPQTGDTLVQAKAKGAESWDDTEYIQNIEQLADVVYDWISEVDESINPQARSRESQPDTERKSGVDAVKETIGKINLTQKTLSEGREGKIDFNVPEIETKDIRIDHKEVSNGIRLTIRYGDKYLIDATCTKQADKDLCDISISFSRKEGNTIIPYPGGPREYKGINPHRAKNLLFSKIGQAVEIIKEKQLETKEPAKKAKSKTPDPSPAKPSSTVASLPTTKSEPGMATLLKDSGVVGADGKATTPTTPKEPTEKAPETFLKIGDRKQSFDIGAIYSMESEGKTVYFKPLRIEGEELIVMEVTNKGEDIGTANMEIKDLRRIPGREWKTHFKKRSKKKK